jgi:hypothetical protein
MEPGSSPVSSLPAASIAGIAGVSSPELSSFAATPSRTDCSTRCASGGRSSIPNSCSWSRMRCGSSSLHTCAAAAAMYRCRLRSLTTSGTSSFFTRATTMHSAAALSAAFCITRRLWRSATSGTSGSTISGCVASGGTRARRRTSILALQRVCRCCSHSTRSYASPTASSTSRTVVRKGGRIPPDAAAAPRTAVATSQIHRLTARQKASAISPLTAARAAAATPAVAGAAIEPSLRSAEAHEESPRRVRRLRRVRMLGR